MTTAIPHGIPRDIEPRETLVEDLRQDVIHLLKQAVDIVERYNKLHKTTSAEFSGTVAIRQALANVEEIALRMAVVAPMKAGKSTIINAIVGQPLLPARNTAMTATATEIILDPNISEPILTVPEGLVNLFRETAEHIHWKCQTDRTSVEKLLRERYPHLTHTLINIISNPLLFERQIKGVENVRTALQPMNDMVRLASELVPNCHVIKQMQELPKIRVAPFTLEEQVINTTGGNLVIIDTPGPNEAGENLNIKNIFAEQLQRSGVVVVVLDFTQLNTEAAKSVQETIEQITQIRGGTKNLYALVNKTDQRRRGDMTPEQVRKFVQRTFNIHSSHIFEVCARRAYCAARFLAEKNYLDESWRELPVAQEFAQEILGIEWQEELENLCLEDLVKRAKQHWQKHSGFGLFYSAVVSRLMKALSSRVIHASINTVRAYNIKLLEEINFQEESHQSEMNNLRHEIKRLNQDIYRFRIIDL